MAVLAWERVQTDRRQSQQWLHRCSESGQRVMSETQIRELGGCPFCGERPEGMIVESPLPGFDEEADE